MLKTKLPIVLFATLAMSGCASLSGYDAASDFSCKAQEGVSCESISGVYQNAQQNNLPSQKKLNGTATPTTDNTEQTESDDLLGIEDEHEDNQRLHVTHQDASQLPSRPKFFVEPVTTGTPVFVPAQKLRVWMVPYEDSTGVLKDQSYAYLLIKKAHWGIEHYKAELERQAQYSINFKMKKQK